MLDLFSTDLIPAPERLEAWRHQAKLICGNSRFQFPRQQAFQGVIDRRSIGGVQVTQFSSTAVAFEKYPTVHADAEDRGCIIISQVRGRREYCQDGKKVTLNPADTTLIDAGRPWSSICSDHCSRLYLRLPHWLVQEKLGLRKLPTVPKISGQSGLGATLFRLGASLHHEAAFLSLEEGLSAVEAYLHILSACIGKVQHQAASFAPGIDDLIDNYIDQHLADPDLSPSQIAAQAGISVRHLHRLFIKRNLTVTEHIRRMRLESCRAQLADPRFFDRNITDIAFSWGFSDSAHFSHCFKKRFGESPRTFRAGLLGRYSAAYGALRRSDRVLTRLN